MTFRGTEATRSLGTPSTLYCSSTPATFIAARSTSLCYGVKTRGNISELLESELKRLEESKREVGLSQGRDINSRKSPKSQARMKPCDWHH